MISNPLSGRDRGSTPQVACVRLSVACPGFFLCATTSFGGACLQDTCTLPVESDLSHVAKGWIFSRVLTSAE